MDLLLGLPCSSLKSNGTSLPSCPAAFLAAPRTCLGSTSVVACWLPGSCVLWGFCRCFLAFADALKSQPHSSKQGALMHF